MFNLFKKNVSSLLPSPLSTPPMPITTAYPVKPGLYMCCCTESDMKWYPCAVFENDDGQLVVEDSVQNRYHVEDYHYNLENPKWGKPIA